MLADESRMVEELLEVEDGLSPREVEFIEDLSRREEALEDEGGYDLTDNQGRWLKQIYERVK